MQDTMCMKQIKLQWEMYFNPLLSWNYMCESAIFVASLESFLKFVYCIKWLLELAQFNLQEFLTALVFFCHKWNKLLLSKNESMSLLQKPTEEYSSHKTWGAQLDWSQHNN